MNHQTTKQPVAPVGEAELEDSLNTPEGELDEAALDEVAGGVIHFKKTKSPFED